MKHAFYFLLVFFCVSFVSAQTTFNKTFGGPQSDYTYAIETLPDGGSIIAGGTSSGGEGSSDVLIVRLNANGDTLWSKTYGGEYDEAARAICIAPDGGYLAVGYTNSFGSGGYDGYAIKINAQGELQWSKAYGDFYTDYFTTVVTDKSDGFMMAGTTNNNTDSTDVYVVHINSLGETQWSKSFGTDLSGDYALSLCKYYDTYYDDWYYTLAGNTYGAGVDNADVLAFQFSETGTWYWAKAYGGWFDDYANSITTISDTYGYYFSINGASNSFTDNMDAYMVNIDENGDTVNTRAWGSTYYESTASSVLSIENDEVYVLSTGFKTNGDNWDVFLNKSKFNDNSNVLWTLVYGGDSADVPLQMKVQNQSIYITGYTQSFGQGEDAFVMKTNAQGYCDGMKSEIIYTPTKQTTTEVTDVDLIIYNFGEEVVCNTLVNTLPIKNKQVLQSVKPYIKAMGGIADDQAYAFDNTPDGGMVFAGETYSHNVYGPYVVKTDANLNIEWAKGLSADYTWGDIQSIITLSDGSYFFTGKNNYNSSLYGKLTAMGDVSWSKSSEQVGSTLKGVKCIETSDRNLVLLTQYTNENSQTGLLLSKLDTAGNLLWEKKLLFANSDEEFSLHATANKGFYVSGNIDVDNKVTSVFVSRYNELGDTIWTQSFTNNTFLYGSTGAQTADDGYVICSDAYGLNDDSQNISIVKLDATGTVEWSKLLGSDVSNYAEYVSSMSDGHILLAMYNNDFPALVKMDLQGNIIWSRSYYSTDMDAWLVSAKETADKGIAILNYNTAFGNGGQDVVVNKLDEFGRGIYCITHDIRLDTLANNVIAFNDKPILDTVKTINLSLELMASDIEPQVLDYTCNVATTYADKFQRAFGNPLYYLYANSFYSSQEGNVYMAYTINENKAAIAKIKPDMKTIEWARTFSNSTTFADDVLQTDDGGVYFLTDDESLGGSYLVKLNMQGDTVWSKSYNEQGWFYRIIQSTDGNMVLVGKGLRNNVGNTGKSDIIVLKIKPNGDTLWSKSYGANGSEVAYSIKETSDGGYIIGGSTDSESIDGYLNALVIKTNNKGEIEWANTYGNDWDELSNSVIETVDKGYLLVGASNSFASEQQLYVTRLSNSGTILWSETFLNNASAIHVIPTSDANYLIGATYNDDITLVKINDFGSLIWAKTYGGSGKERINSLQQALDGGYFAYGRSNSFSSRHELYLVKTDKEGNSGDCHENNISNIQITPVQIYQNPFAPTVIPNNVVVTHPTILSKNKTTSMSAREMIMQITIDSTAVRCNGESNGSINLSITNGIAPYSYAWSSGESTQTIQSKPASMYTVTVSDKYSCIIKREIEITQPTAFTIDTLVQSISCYGLNDGKINMYPLGGVAPYRYSWNNGSISDSLWDLSPNKYSVNVFDNNGCLLTGNFVITQPKDISIKFTPTNITCGNTNGSIQVQASGGTGLLSYKWNNNQAQSYLTNLSNGNYTLTVTDKNKCSKVDTVTLGIDTEQPQICVVTVGVSGYNVVAWERNTASDIKEYKVYKKSHWNNAFNQIGVRAYNDSTFFVDKLSTPLVHSDWYAIRLVDACNNESELSTPHKTMHLTSNLGVGGTVNLIWEQYEGLNVDKYYVYRGLHKDTLELIDTLLFDITTYTDINPPKTFDLFYLVEMQLKDTCYTDALSKAQERGPYGMSRSNFEDAGIFNMSINDDANEWSQSIELYPNPAINQLQVILSGDNTLTVNALEVSNIYGQILSSQAVPSKQSQAVTLNVQHLPAGTYYLKLTTNQGMVVKKFVKVD